MQRTKTIEVENLSKTFYTGDFKELSLVSTLSNFFKFKRKEKKLFYALNDVSFCVYKGEIFGILGKNGAGKSTLLKILSRITYPDSGKIELKGKVSSLIEIGAGFHAELTGLENIYLKGSILGMKRKEIYDRVESIVSFAEVGDFINTKLKHYSSGMKVRLGFAISVFLNAEILVIDEVLAVGDKDFKQKCISKIRELAASGKTIIFVSHDIPLVRKLCHRGLILDKGKVLIVENVDLLVSHYLSTSVSSEISYNNGPLEKVKIIIDNKGQIVFIVNYKNLEKGEVPNFGFIVYDQMGNPLFGNNLVDQKKVYEIKYPRDGVLRYTILDPKLTSGKYTASIWYGNGKVDFFSDYHAIRFEVFGESNNWPIISKLNYEVC